MKFHESSHNVLMLAVVLLLSLQKCVLASSFGPSPYKTLTFTQNLDHFNYKDTRTFVQRYLLNDVYGSSKAMLFYTGNEGNIEDFYDNSGFVLELAKSFGALVVFAEHRYYGASLPFGSATQTFKPENMGYLSVEQALADYAVLVQYLKEKYTLSRVIAFGGSYGGMLTAYIRFKYPNLIDGGLASSAPIFIVANITDPAAFYSKVTQDFADVDSSCPDLARTGFSLIYQYAQTDQGVDILKNEFNLCSFQADKVDHLVGWVRNSFTSLAMLDYPYPTDFLAPLPGFPVRKACQLLVQYPNSVTGLAKAAALFYLGNKSNKSSCFDIFTDYIKCADPTGCGTGPDSMAWDYQACTEMRLPIITNNVTDMFPPTSYDPSAYCLERWGVEARPDWTSTQFWGSDIQAASNIIFSNGDLDPWSVGGVLQSSNDKINIIRIQDAAHHLDLRGTNPNDPPSVVQARQKEKDIIHSWLDCD